jgi:hypothetical protein
VVRLPQGSWTTPLVLLALSACNQSLFDNNVGDDDDGDVADDGGDDIADDAPGDDGGDDTGDDGGDDGGNVDCPAPCQGDPVVEFSLEQGGTSGRWFYLTNRTGANANGSVYEELQPGTYQGAPAWVVDDNVGPAIVSCAGSSPPAVCAGAGESLVLVPTDARAAGDPVLAFRAPTNGTYRLIGNFRLPEAFEEGVAMQFLVSRNARHDLQFKTGFLSSVTAEELEVDVEALAGDLIEVALPRANPGRLGGLPLAFDFGVTLLGGEDDIFPGRCMFAATFDEEDPFTDRCGGATLANLNDDETLPGFTEGGPSVIDQLGSARVFQQARYMRSMGAPMDYSGDFTIQFWAQFAEPQPSFSSVVFSDAVEDAFGGVVFVLDDTDPIIDASYIWNEGQDPPPTTPPNNFIRGAPPRDGDWHFHRITRDTAEGAILYCIDGRLQGTDPGPGSFDMTSDTAPHLGKGVFNQANYAGSLDDVRIFRRALPCASFP